MVIFEIKIIYLEIILIRNYIEELYEKNIDIKEDLNKWMGILNVVFGGEFKYFESRNFF